MSEKPVRDRPRRLADWPNLAGCEEDPLLGGSGFQVEGFGDLAAEKRRPQSSSPRLGPKSHSQAPRPVRPLGLAGACAPALPESFVAPASRMRFCESWMRENRTSSLSGGRRPALRRASSDPIPGKPGNSGGGKGPEFKKGVRRGNGQGEWCKPVTSRSNGQDPKAPSHLVQAVKRLRHVLSCPRAGCGKSARPGSMSGE